MTTTENGQRDNGGAWKVERVKADRSRRREYIWEVTCPETPPEPTWGNDLLRGHRCGCRRFPTEGKANRYVDGMGGVRALGAEAEVGA